MAQKFGEEAVECLIEAVAGNQEALVAESADVLYHLLVMWVAAGVQPDAGLGRAGPPRRHQRRGGEGIPHRPRRHDEDPLTAPARRT